MQLRESSAFKWLITITSTPQYNKHARTSQPPFAASVRLNPKQDPSKHFAESTMTTFCQQRLQARPTTSNTSPSSPPQVQMLLPCLLICSARGKLMMRLWIWNLNEDRVFSDQDSSTAALMQGGLKAYLLGSVLACWRVIWLEQWFEMLRRN